MMNARHSANLFLQLGTGKERLVWHLILNESLKPNKGWSVAYCKVLPMNFLTHSQKSPTAVQVQVLKSQTMCRQTLVVLRQSMIIDVTLFYHCLVPDSYLILLVMTGEFTCLSSPANTSLSCSPPFHFEQYWMVKKKIQRLANK